MEEGRQREGSARQDSSRPGFLLCASRASDHHIALDRCISIASTMTEVAVS